MAHLKKVCLTCVFFKKMGHRLPLFVLFRSFQSLVHFCGKYERYVNKDPSSMQHCDSNSRPLLGLWAPDHKSLFSNEIVWSGDLRQILTAVKYKLCGIKGSARAILFWKKWANPGLFSSISGLYKQTIQFLQQINVKNVHPVNGAGIWTHNLLNMSLHP